MGFDAEKKSEDCLYLNVWTPSKTMADRLPVVIYFNGGGLIAGSGSEPRYSGRQMARHGIVAVTANYREGIFGFFSHPQLSKKHLIKVLATMASWIRRLPLSGSMKTSRPLAVIRSR